ncbi:MAG: AAA family ATPase [Thermogemmatispora sp.]|uniref:AAA family ATPase n=1 Tax=Thermogemmatispora sp. TaxID=1968838 RepID=UPI0019D8F588|nr:AAA family ATPase [Thermogemmatispora sp.]MBE3564803.1 AAA family ATPase [Thermogemmatispora sp.]
MAEDAMKEQELLHSGESLSGSQDHRPSDEPALSWRRELKSKEIAVLGLEKLWHQLHLTGPILIFHSPFVSLSYLDHYEHHPLLLDRLVAAGQRRKRPRFGQLSSWRPLPAPDLAWGLTVSDRADCLFKSDLTRRAGLGDRGTQPASLYGWKLYRFASGWTALSVYYVTEYNDNIAFVALPQGRQDEWLAFLDLLVETYKQHLHQHGRGSIEIVGVATNPRDLITVIRQASWNDVILPEGTRALVEAQRRIFDPTILRRYAALRVPRLRKVLLVGPPGTGKTTLLKAEGAYHARRGGRVLYVMPSAHNSDGGSAWNMLSIALQTAADSRLPTLILVEDFELFVSDPKEQQIILNTLDGVATPDNPAGTLLLATSNNPEQIDPRIRDRPGRIDALIELGLVQDEKLAVRFLQHLLRAGYREEEHAPVASQLLGQPGSHLREVCLTAALHALEDNRTAVLAKDLLWAHEVILKGRAAAAQSERFAPPPPQRRGGYFGKR